MKEIRMIINVMKCNVYVDLVKMSDRCNSSYQSICITCFPLAMIERITYSLGDKKILYIYIYTCTSQLKIFGV